MKKKIVSLALAVCLLAIAAVGTLAYFTDKTETKTNTFTVGNVNITLTEPNWDEPETVEPGLTYAKDPTVTNVGANDAYIRVDVTVSDWAAFTAAAAAHNITDLTTIFGGYVDADWTRMNISVNSDADTATYSYFYKSILAVGDDATLFTDVTIPAAFTSAEMAALGEDFTIDVIAYAIQADGLTAETAMTELAAL